MSSFKTHEFVAHSTEVNCLSFAPKTHEILATGGEDCKVNIWRVGSAKNLWTLGSNKSPIECVCFDDEEQCVVSGSMNGSLKVFDLNEGRLARSLRGHQVNVGSIHYHPYGEFIASGSADTTMKVWDVRQKLCIQTYTGHQKEVTCVRFSPDGRWVASSAKDGLLLIWDLIAGKLISTITLAPTHITNFEFNPCDLLLAASTANKAVRIFDMESMEKIGQTPAETGNLKGIAFCGENATNVCAATGDSLKAWSWEPMTSLAQVQVGWDRVADMKVSQEGRLLAGSFHSNFVSIWDINLSTVLSGNASSDRASDGIQGSSGSSSSSCSSYPAIPTRPAPSRPRTGETLSSTQSVQHQPSTPPRTRALSPDAVLVSAANGKGSLRYTDLLLDSSDNKMGGKEEMNGSVIWEPGSESAAKDMSTSMGESFWNRNGTRSRPATSWGTSDTPLMDCGLGIGIGHEHGICTGTDTGGGPQVAEAKLSLGDSGGRRLEMALAERKLNASLGKSKERERDAKLLYAASQGQGHEARVTMPGRLDGDIFSANTNSRKIIKDSEKTVPPQTATIPVSISPSSSSTAEAKLEQHSQNHDRDAKSAAAGAAPSRSSPSLIRNRHFVGADKDTVLVPKNNGSTSTSTNTNDRDRDTTHSSPSIPSSRHFREVLEVTPVHSQSQCQGQSRVGSARVEKADPSVNVEELLRAASSTSNKFTSSLTQRLASMRILKKFWTQGDYNEAITQLQTLVDCSISDIGQLVTASDFLASLELVGGIIQKLSLDGCTLLAPILERLCSEGPDGVCISGIRAVISLCEVYGDLIRSTRSVLTTGVRPVGVDISRDERLRKCNVCHHALERVFMRIDSLRHFFRQSPSVLQQIDRLYSCLAKIM